MNDFHYNKERIVVALASASASHSMEGPFSRSSNFSERTEKREKSHGARDKISKADRVHLSLAGGSLLSRSIYDFGELSVDFLASDACQRL